MSRICQYNHPSLLAKMPIVSCSLPISRYQAATCNLSDSSPGNDRMWTIGLASCKRRCRRDIAREVIVLCRGPEVYLESHECRFPKLSQLQDKLFILPAHSSNEVATTMAVTPPDHQPQQQQNRVTSQSRLVRAIINPEETISELVPNQNNATQLHRDSKTRNSPEQSAEQGSTRHQRLTRPDKKRTTSE
jgi:hypothetical protein